MSLDVPMSKGSVLLFKAPVIAKNKLRRSGAGLVK
jgi:hypothetical protein